jgi:predicted DNA-binding transcriptional regulator AlpA
VALERDKQADGAAAKHARHVHADDLGAPYLTACMLAGMLATSDATVYRMAKADPTMPKLQIGGIVRFPRDRVIAWLRSREQGLAAVRRPRPSIHQAVSG